MSTTLNPNSTNPITTNNPIQAAMKVGEELAVTVNAPNASRVRFASTQGIWIQSTWVNPTLSPNAAIVNVSGNEATAILSTSQAGIATIYVDNPDASGSSASLAVAMTATTAAKITIQASPSVVPKSVGSTKGISTLIATVTDANGMPVGDAPVSFSIINSTGGGESVSPALALTTSTTTNSLGLGQASTNFISGSKSTVQNGVQIRAQVLGTSVVTEAAGVNLTASGNDAAIVIGGTAASIAFGSATVLTENSNKSGYIQAMSVLVADSNGSPAPAGTVVSLSIWPIAWSTGESCTPDLDGYIWKNESYIGDPNQVQNAPGHWGRWISGSGGTFYNEDINENLFIDSAEDGVRKYFSSGIIATGTGYKDSLGTPTNSAAGTVPSSVTTDANGLATFDLNYGKNSAIWVVARIRARTQVQGSEAMSEWSFRLPGLHGDITPVCYLPNSPYKF